MIDAVVCPTARPEHSRAAAVARALGARFVPLISGAAAGGIPIPPGYQLPGFPITRIGYGTGDLAVKRTAGLLLARLAGWRRILFLDDDITLGPNQVRLIRGRLAGGYTYASATIRDFPDNSVVRHAEDLTTVRSVVTQWPTGAVLAVDVTRPVSFFPDIYNEDWFFLNAHGRNDIRHDVGLCGWAYQDPYDPFADPQRAAREELGDLLAEGWNEARYMTARSWGRVIVARHRLIERVRSQTSTVPVLACLEAAQTVLDTITARQCVDVIHEWRSDVKRWDRHLRSQRRDLGFAGALDELQLGEMSEAVT